MCALLDSKKRKLNWEQHWSDSTGLSFNTHRNRPPFLSTSRFLVGYDSFLEIIILNQCRVLNFDPPRAKLLLRAVTEVKIRISCSHLHTLNNAIFAVAGKDFFPSEKVNSV